MIRVSSIFSQMLQLFSRHEFEQAVFEHRPSVMPAGSVAGASSNLVHKLNNHGSFAHGIGDTLHALSSDIANRENPGKARFEHIRSPVQGPALLNLDTGLYETFCVGRETPSKPFSVGVRRGSASATDGP